MPGAYCVAFGCSNRKTKGKSFHKFPRDEARRKQWEAAVNRDNFKVTEHSRICADHFDESCFDRTGQNTRLRDTAVPTIFRDLALVLKEKKNRKVSAARSKPTDSLPSPNLLPPQQPTNQKTDEQSSGVRNEGKTLMVRLTRVKRLHKNGPEGRLKRQKKSGPEEKLKRLRKNGPEENLKRQDKTGPQEKLKRQQKNGSEEKFNSQQTSKQRSKERQKDQSGSHQPLQAEGQQEWGSGFTHSPGYQHWKCLGAQQGLCEDSDIACFLLKYYEHTSRVLPSDLGGVCKTCGTPLSISCTCCDWTICAQAPPSSEHDVTHSKGDRDSTGVDHDPEVKTYGHFGEEKAQGEREAGEPEKPCEPQDIELEWDTDTYEEFQETAVGDSAHNPANNVHGFHTTVETEKDHSTEGFLDIKPGSLNNICREIKCEKVEISHENPEDEKDDAICDPYFDEDPGEDESTSVHEETQLVESRAQEDGNDADTVIEHQENLNIEQDVATVYEHTAVTDDVNPYMQFSCGEEEVEEREPKKEDQTFQAVQGLSQDDSQICFVVNRNDGTGESLGLEETSTLETEVCAHRDGKEMDDMASGQQNIEGNKVTKRGLFGKSEEHGSALHFESERDAHQKIELTEMEQMIEEGKWVSLEDPETSQVILAIHTPETESDMLGQGGEDDSQIGLLVQGDEQTGFFDIIQDVWKNMQDTDFNGTEQNALDNADPCSFHAQSDEEPLSPKNQSCSSDNVADEDTTQNAAHSSQLCYSQVEGGKPLNMEISKEHGYAHSQDHSYSMSSSSISAEAKRPLPSSSEQLTKLFQCDVCDKQFNGYYSFKRHKTRHLGKQFVCEVCGKSFPDTYYLRCHIRNVHDDNNPAKEPAQCDICGITVRKHKLKIHMKKCSNPDCYKCETCGKGFNRKLAFNQHRQSHSDQTQSKKKKKKRNVRNTGNDENETANENSVCEKTDINHDKSHHVLCKISHSKGSQHPHNMGESQTFMCDKCGQTFRKRSALISHYKTHFKVLKCVKVLKCDICDKAFCTAYKLLMHKRKHSNHRPYICETCGFAFKLLSTLKKHKITVHEGHKPHSCTVCSKSFFHKYVLINHMKIHTRLGTEGKRVRRSGPPYVCEQCGRQFSRYSNCKTHELTHTGVKPYQCDVCHKWFSQANSVKIHKRIHLGLKPFECDICRKTFRERGSMTKHKKKIHT